MRRGSVMRRLSSPPMSSTSKGSRAAARAPWRCWSLAGALARAAPPGGGCDRPLPLAGAIGRAVDRSRHHAARGGHRLGRRRRADASPSCCTNGSAGRGRRGASAPAATRSTPAPRRSQLLDKMVQGDETLEKLRLVEGWTLAPGARRARRRAAPEAAERRHERRELMQALGEPGVARRRPLLPRHLRLQPRRQRPGRAAARPRARCSGGWTPPGRSARPTRR